MTIRFLQHTWRRNTTNTPLVIDWNIQKPSKKNTNKNLKIYNKFWGYRLLSSPSRHLFYQKYNKNRLTLYNKVH